MGSTRLTVLSAYVWIAMVAFGGIAVETLVIYPNVFHDVPASLTESVKFFAVTGPADFFPPLGLATAAAAVAAVVTLWRIRRARWWVAASLGTLVIGEWLFSMMYFWPRNTIMFDQGIAVHTADVLRQAAVEFETGHWFRLGMSAVTATLAFVGLLRAHRDRSLAGSPA